MLLTLNQYGFLKVLYLNDLAEFIKGSFALAAVFLGQQLNGFVDTAHRNSTGPSSKLLQTVRKEL